ncbi:MAG: GNAT family N-acetyltransferase [Rikenellaceae bacterium]|nr:GNAT family N-acetyltransferase [Rikenellaceae bacterium]MCL2692698.1 GNAT family N-acetyltransferase [Rikenellaceae bacterium]
MTNNLLESDAVRLRALEPEDVDLLYKWENDTNVWKVSNTTVPFSRHILRQFIDSQKYDIFETRQLRLIIEEKEQQRAVGTVDLFDIDPYNRRAGVGIIIYDKRDKGQGYASAALQLLIRYVFMALNLHQIYCNILSDNTASLNLFRSKGFLTVGAKRGWVRTTSGWTDEYMLQLLNPKKE